MDFRIKQANATVPCKPTHPNVTVTLRQLESWTVGVKDNLHNNVIQVVKKCCPGKKKVLITNSQVQTFWYRNRLAEFVVRAECALGI